VSEIEHHEHGTLRNRIERATGRVVLDISPLSGGCVAEVMRADLDHAEPVVVKVDNTTAPTLDIEGFMLSFLRERSSLPVPRVLHAEPALLVIELLPGSTGAAERAEPHAAGLLADLHEIAAPEFGFERDTLIGPLRQPNPWSSSWVEFFAEHRLLYMTRIALGAGSIDATLARSIQRLASRLDRLLTEPERPSLVHGDVWSGNVLTQGDRVTGLIDPATHFANAEVELAFITLFGCFGRTFFDAYAERRPIDAGFFEARRDIYNLYPLLVHAHLFGGGHAGSVAATVRRFVS
jgi:fructosamine-3-kinase